MARETDEELLARRGAIQRERARIRDQNKALSALREEQALLARRNRGLVSRVRYREPPAEPQPVIEIPDVAGNINAYGGSAQPAGQPPAFIPPQVGMPDEPIQWRLPPEEQRRMALAAAGKAVAGQASGVLGLNSPEEKLTAGDVQPAGQAQQSLDLQIPGGGGGEDLSPTMNLKSSSYSTPELSKEAAAQINAQQQAYQAALIDIQRKREVIDQRHMETMGKWAALAEQDRERYGQRANVLSKRFDAATQELQRIQTQINEAKLDPDTWEHMTNGQAAVAGLAMAFSRYSSMGTEGAIRVLDSGIQRDLAVQRARIQKLIQSAQLTQSQANHVWSQWQQIEAQRANAARDMAKFELARQATESGSLEARLKAADLIRASATAGIMATNATRGKGTSTTHEVINPMALAQAKAAAKPLLSPEDMRQFRKEVTPYSAGQDMITKAFEIIKTLPKDKDGMPLFNLGGGKGGDLNAFINALAGVSRSLAGDTGPVSEGDKQFFNFIKNRRFGDLTKMKDITRRLSNLYDYMEERKHKIALGYAKSFGQYLSEAQQYQSRGPRQSPDESLGRKD